MMILKPDQQRQNPCTHPTQPIYNNSIRSPRRVNPPSTLIDDETNSSPTRASQSPKSNKIERRELQPSEKARRKQIHQPAGMSVQDLPPCTIRDRGMYVYEAKNRLEDEGDPEERRNRIAKIHAQEESKRIRNPASTPPTGP